MNRYFSVILLTLLAGAVFASPPKVIVIDPGHGGKDPGATFRGVKEKDITLGVSVLLQKILAKRLKGEDIQIVLTRSKDEFHSAKEKAEIANQLKGELFVSIHANSSSPIRRRYYRYVKKPYYVTEGGKKVKKYKKARKYYYANTYNNKANGTEIFIWASDRSDDKGSAISSYDELHGESSENIPDMNSPELRILGQLYAQQFFKRSFKLANMVDDEFKKIQRVSRGVKQRNSKGIWVLQATAMPAILVELGFVTHKQEAQFMSSKKGQESLAKAIANAVEKYVSSQ